MSIEDYFTTGWTAKKNTEAVDSGGAVTDTLSTDTSIGTAGVFSACKRQLSGRELERYAKKEYEEVYRIYTTTSGFTVKHWILDTDSLLWNVVNVNNPHDLDEFYQIDVVRSDFERENE